MVLTSYYSLKISIHLQKEEQFQTFHLLDCHDLTSEEIVKIKLVDPTSSADKASLTFHSEESDDEQSSLRV